jgi:predicted dehydrogenase
MSHPLTIVVVGIGGYGHHFMNALLDAPSHQDVRIVGTVDPRPDGYERLDELRARRIPHFDTLDDFYRAHTADLAVISSPIQFHADQVCTALSHGSHVLCEKPLCCTPADADRMAAAQQAAGRHVAIGYQWSFSGAVQELKADILAGRFGKPRRLRCLTLWPRDDKYYNRNRWAGATHDEQGRPVFDSPVNNACAHHLHHLFYLLGDKANASAAPTTLTAELFRANAIANYDTAAIRCGTSAGADILFVTSHAVRSRLGPNYQLEFENAVVEYVDAPSAIIKATFTSGSTICYGSPDEPRDRKLWCTVAAIRKGEPALCPIGAAASHTRAVAMAQAAGIADFPKRLIRTVGEPGSQFTVVQGLDGALRRCYEQWSLPSELDFAWASRPSVKQRLTKVTA